MHRNLVLLLLSYCLLAVACDKVKDNPAPDPLQGLELRSLQFDLEGNGPWVVNFQDSFPSNAPLTYQISQQPSNGTVVLDANGNFVFTPDSGFYGNDYAIYQICNGADCRDGIINVSVEDTTTPCTPVVNDYSFEIEGGPGVLIPLPEQYGCGAGITAIITNGIGGLQLINGKVFASLSQNQIDTVRFGIVSCNEGKCDTGNVQLIVGANACLQKFKANLDSVIKVPAEREFNVWITNRVGTTHLLYNDSACKGDLNPASFEIVSGFSRGTFTLREPNTQGRAIRYKANVDFTAGSDTLTYKISGYSGATSIAKVFIKFIQ